MRWFCALLTVFLLTPALHAQDNAAGTGGTYLIPQIIFVGDRGTLVTTLDKNFAAAEPFVLQKPEPMPQAENLVISRIELDKRNNSQGQGPRLLVEFAAYAPGRIVFPDIAIPSPGGTLWVKGLEAQAASILDTEDAGGAMLSPPAAHLAVPGTGFLVYGAVLALLALLFVFVAGGVWGRRHLGSLRKRWRRRSLIRSMGRLIRRLRTESSGGAAAGDLFTLLSREFREFLSFFTGVDCRALSPGEFLEVALTPPPLNSGGGEAQKAPQKTVIEPQLSPGFLTLLFRRWETLRFSGAEIGQAELLGVLDEVRDFTAALDRAERARP